MNRRTLLSTVGVTTLSGCLSRFDGKSESRNGSDSTDEEPSASVEANASTTAAGSDETQRHDGEMTRESEVEGVPTGIFVGRTDELPEGEESCRFEGLSEADRAEVEDAVEKMRYWKGDNPKVYLLDESDVPSLSSCTDTYIEYGEYYYLFTNTPVPPMARESEVEGFPGGGLMRRKDEPPKGQEICRFEELSEAERTDFEEAIETKRYWHGVDPEVYLISSSDIPSLSNCEDTYIEYGEYYYQFPGMIIF